MLLLQCVVVIINFLLPFWTIFICLQWNRNKFFDFIIQEHRLLTVRGLAS